MSLAIAPFDERYLDGAAALVAARQAHYRSREPALPAAFESPEVVRPLLEQMLSQESTSGIAALRDGEPVGFVLASAVLPPPRQLLAHFYPPRSLSIAYHGHALAADEEPSLFRQLYAALAGDWVHRGYFDHFVGVLDQDHADREAWDSLGFGRDSTCAVREVARPVTAKAEVEVHQAGPEEIEVIGSLDEALWEHHTGSPTFMPYLPEMGAVSREMNLQLLADAANALFVAYRNDQPLGMTTFMPPGFVSRLVTPDSCVYLWQGVVYPEARGAGVGGALLAHSMAWAEEQGYRWCALHFMAANLSAAAFWLGNGFRPLEHRLHRRVDDRISWAGR